MGNVSLHFHVSKVATRKGLFVYVSSIGDVKKVDRKSGFDVPCEPRAFGSLVIWNSKNSLACLTRNVVAVVCAVIMVVIRSHHRWEIPNNYYVKHNQVQIHYE